MEEQLELYEEALMAIHDISIDYGGHGDNLEELKDLVDELRSIANNALNGRDLF